MFHTSSAMKGDGLAHGGVQEKARRRKHDGLLVLCHGHGHGHGNARFVVGRVCRLDIAKSEAIDSDAVRFFAAGCWPSFWAPCVRTRVHSRVGVSSDGSVVRLRH